MDDLVHGDSPLKMQRDPRRRKSVDFFSAGKTSAVVRSRSSEPVLFSGQTVQVFEFSGRKTEEIGDGIREEILDDSALSVNSAKVTVDTPITLERQIETALGLLSRYKTSTVSCREIMDFFKDFASVPSHHGKSLNKRKGIQSYFSCPVSTYSPIESLFGKVKQIESISKLCWKKQVEIGQSIHKDIAPMMNYFISSIPEKQSKLATKLEKEIKQFKSTEGDLQKLQSSYKKLDDYFSYLQNEYSRIKAGESQRPDDKTTVSIKPHFHEEIMGNLSNFFGSFGSLFSNKGYTYGDLPKLEEKITSLASERQSTRQLLEKSFNDYMRSKEAFLVCLKEVVQQVKEFEQGVIDVVKTMLERLAQEMEMFCINLEKYLIKMEEIFATNDQEYEQDLAHLARYGNSFQRMQLSFFKLFSSNSIVTEDTNYPLDFSNLFSILSKTSNSSILFSKAFIALMKESAHMEENYGLALARLAEYTFVKSRGSIRLGLRSCTDILKFLSNLHRGLSSCINADILNLTSLEDDASKVEKQILDCIKSFDRSLVDLEHVRVAAKNDFDEANRFCADTLTSVNKDTSKSTKESIDKLEKTRIVYEGSLKESHRKQIVFETTGMKLLQSFQRLEQDRIESLESSLRRSISLRRIIQQKFRYCAQILKSRLSALSMDQDLLNFYSLASELVSENPPTEFSERSSNSLSPSETRNFSEESWVDIDHELSVLNSPKNAHNDNDISDQSTLQPSSSSAEQLMSSWSDKFPVIHSTDDLLLNVDSSCEYQDVMQEVFECSIEEKLLISFSCILRDSDPILGSLCLSRNYISFYSSEPKTSKILRLSEVAQIEKEGLDIRVHSITGSSLVFSSFVFLNEALTCTQNILFIQRAFDRARIEGNVERRLSSADLHNRRDVAERKSLEMPNILSKLAEDKFGEKIEEPVSYNIDAVGALNNTVCISSVDSKVVRHKNMEILLEEVYPVSSRGLFELILSDDAESLSRMKVLYSKDNISDVIFTTWRDSTDFPGWKERTMTASKQLGSTYSFMGAKIAKIESERKLAVLENNHFVYQEKIKMTGFPYADVFFVLVDWDLTAHHDKSQCNLVVAHRVEFTKSSFFRGLILKSAKNDLLSFYRLLDAEVRALLDTGALTEPLQSAADSKNAENTCAKSESVFSHQPSVVSYLRPSVIFIFICGLCLLAATSYFYLLSSSMQGQLEEIQSDVQQMMESLEKLTDSVQKIQLTLENPN